VRSSLQKLAALRSRYTANGSSHGLEGETDCSFDIVVACKELAWNMAQILSTAHRTQPELSSKLTVLTAHVAAFAND
jgi:hypothetical protein